MRLGRLSPAARESGALDALRLLGAGNMAGCSKGGPFGFLKSAVGPAGFWNCPWAMPRGLCGPRKEREAVLRDQLIPAIWPLEDRGRGSIITGAIFLQEEEADPPGERMRRQFHGSERCSGKKIYRTA